MKRFVGEARLSVLRLFPSIASQISPQGRIHMLRFARSAVALVGVLAVAQPVFADPLTATASDYAQTAADAIEQPAWSWSSDAPATADVLVEPVGNAVSQKSGGMSFIVAAGVLLLALLAGIVLDGIGVRKPKARRDISDL
jgi:hypothetical protein